MDFGQMRDYSEFCEQLNEMRVRFHKWDGCEQTVALYYLMVSLPFANAKFLHHALEQCIGALATPDSLIIERNANDASFIRRLLSERPHIALGMLQTHLPLLRPGNKDTVDAYLITIRRVLSEFITPQQKIYNECVEIMTYMFVHPAFSTEEKKSFKHLLKQVITRVTPENFVHSPLNESSDESASPKPSESTSNRFRIDSELQERLNRRSNSLTPENLPDVWSSQENLTHLTMKPRSFSLSSDKSITLNSTLQSSASETRLQDLQTMCNQPMMRSVVSWLKSLRLHKYSWVFNNLGYEQMMNLSDEALEAIGITKGARHKLLLSIGKLKERSVMLTMLETEVMNGCELAGALRKLKSVILSPMMIMAPGEDLPAQFVKVMGKVCTQLLMMRQPMEETLTNFSALCDRAETNDAFTIDQRRRLTLWKGQVKRATYAPIVDTPVQIMSNTNYQSRLQSTSTNSFAMPVSTASHKEFFNAKSSSYPNMQNNQAIIGGHRHSIGSITLNSAMQSLPLQAIFKGDTCFNYQPSSPATRAIHSTKVAHTSTLHNHHNHTMPLAAPHHHVRFQEVQIDGGSHAAKAREQRLKNVDIESSLESLCLQMMEHALGP